MKSAILEKYLGFGLGLRTAHYDAILGHWPKEVDWFEIISENFMNTEGYPREVLEQVRAHYPVIMHGVSLSIASTDPLNYDYLAKLKTLADWLKPAWVSDHLCWTGYKDVNSHDLLPVPYTEESLKHVVSRIKQVQDFLGRRILLENPSTYLTYRGKQMREEEFITRMAEDADCLLLLDVNNVYVSCYNHGWDAEAYLGAIPAHRVQQIHLAGHDNKGTHIVDTHDNHVAEAVWQLYAKTIARMGPKSTMVEWDGNVPDFATVLAELSKARKFASAEQQASQEKSPTAHSRPGDNLPPPTIAASFAHLQGAILKGEAEDADAWVTDKPNFPPQKQVGVYIDGYRGRLESTIREEFPASAWLLGKGRFDKLVQSYVETTTSAYPDLTDYSLNFASFARTALTEKWAQEMFEFEATLARMIDAPAAKGLGPQDFASMDEEALLAAHFTLKRGCALKQYEYPVLDYYQAYQENQKPPITKAVEACYVLLTRAGEDVWRIKLEREEYQLLSRLKGNIPLEQLLSFLGSKALEEKFPNWLSQWVQQGVLVAG